MEENKNYDGIDEIEDAEVVITDAPVKESRAKTLFEKAGKFAAFACGGVLALFAANKIGENRGRRKTLETLDGYEVKVSTDSDETVEEVEVNE